MPADVIEETAENAVRNYLLFLEDPRRLIDHDLVESLQAQAEQATDPIARLKLYAQLERVQCSDGSQFRVGFVLHAKSWAQANSIGVTAFKRLGVSDEVLKSAGLLTNEARSTRRSARSEPGATRASVTVESIKDHVRSLRGTFTLADVQSAVGGSPMTVRKGVQSLVDDRTIARRGPMENWSGRGRAPIVFEVSEPSGRRVRARK